MARFGTRWIRFLHDRLVFRRRGRRLGAAVADVLPRDAAVLDIGCGDGSVAAHVRACRPDVRLVGVEVLRRPTCRVDVALYDGERLPVADRSVDAAVLVDVLHHTAKADRTLAEAVRVSRRFVIIKDHACTGPWRRTVLRVMDWVGNWPRGIRSPGYYLSEAGWSAMWARHRLRLVDERDLRRLYPFPFRLIFGRRLHFLAVLEKMGPAQTAGAPPSDVSTASDVSWP